MTRVLGSFFIVMLVSHMAQATSANAVSAVDSQLISNCAARTDARMESMTLGKLEQIRNYEFSLRIAMAQLAAGSNAMSPSEWQKVTAKLREARIGLAKVCEVAVPLQG